MSNQHLIKLWFGVKVSELFSFQLTSEKIRLLLSSAKHLLSRLSLSPVDPMPRASAISISMLSWAFTALPQSQNPNRSGENTKYGAWAKNEAITQLWSSSVSGSELHLHDSHLPSSLRFRFDAIRFPRPFAGIPNAQWVTRSFLDFRNGKIQLYTTDHI